ncbi:MAG: hypothetical protein K9K82_09280 [Desulfobacteraceae bacterium]|nr:hypothetical protein [Desulfobacteraceae bacterium]
MNINIAQVKAQLEADNPPDKRTLERYLRHTCGFTQKQAKAFLSRGYKGLAGETGGEVEALQDLIGKLKNG